MVDAFEGAQQTRTEQQTHSSVAREEFRIVFQIEIKVAAVRGASKLESVFKTATAPLTVPPTAFDKIAEERRE